METKFTKGELEANIIEKPFSERAFVRSKNYEGVITLLETRSIANFEEQKANAKLIAAAPEMLEALNEMISLWERVHCGSVMLGKPTLNIAKKAIKKAIG